MSASCRSPGRRSPGARSPAAIRRSSSWATRSATRSRGIIWNRGSNEALRTGRASGSDRSQKSRPRANWPIGITNLPPLYGIRRPCRQGGPCRQGASCRQSVRLSYQFRRSLMPSEFRRIMFTNNELIEAIHDYNEVSRDKLPPGIILTRTPVSEGRGGGAARTGRPAQRRDALGRARSRGRTPRRAPGLGRKRRLGPGCKGSGPCCKGSGAAIVRPPCPIP